MYLLMKDDGLRFKDNRLRNEIRIMLMGIIIYVLGSVYDIIYLNHHELFNIMFIYSVIVLMMIWCVKASLEKISNDAECEKLSFQRIIEA
jgi:hypothetical protein